MKKIASLGFAVAVALTGCASSESGPTGEGSGSGSDVEPPPPPPVMDAQGAYRVNSTFDIASNMPGAAGSFVNGLIEACKTVEGATALMARISNAQEDHVITPAEAREIDKAIIACSDQLRVLSELNARGRGS